VDVEDCFGLSVCVRVNRVFQQLPVILWRNLMQKYLMMTVVWDDLKRLQRREDQTCKNKNQRLQMHDMIWYDITSHQYRRKTMKVIPNTLYTRYLVYMVITY